MGIWTHKDRRSVLEDAENFGNGPSGGRVKQWVAGMLVALLPVGYGICCLRDGHATLFGRRGSIDLVGSSATALSIAYIALGAFVHFHYFWGLDSNLSRFSQGGKLVSLLVFLSCFLFVVYRVIDVSGWIQ